MCPAASGASCPPTAASTATDADPSYLGDAVGHWEGDTLVVDTMKFNEDTWLTDNGAFHTTDLHVVERLHHAGDVLEYEAISEDPKVLSEPWKKTRLAKLSHDELAEPTPCVDQDLKSTWSTTRTIRIRADAQIVCRAVRELKELDERRVGGVSHVESQAVVELPGR